MRSVYPYSSCIHTVEERTSGRKEKRTHFVNNIDQRTYPWKVRQKRSQRPNIAVLNFDQIEEE